MPTTSDYGIHRWYEAQTGRYTKVDPFGGSVVRSTFGYATGNPLRLTDPMGLFEIDPSCDCPPTPLQPDDVPTAIGKARKYFNSPGCQKILAEYPGTKDCLGPRFGPNEIGKGPKIVCQENPNRHVPPCGEYKGAGRQAEPATIILFPGHPECPRFKPNEGLGQTVFHETVHSCGLEAHDEVFKAIVKACTGGE